MAPTTAAIVRTAFWLLGKRRKRPTGLTAAA
jgi:hypothetical protein